MYYFAGSFPQEQTLNEMGNWTVFDGELYQKYLHQKTVKTGSPFWIFDKKWHFMPQM